jgi:hypothetical protein
MVNAATQPESALKMDTSNKEPSAAAAVGAVTNLQLRRYDDDSIVLVKAKLEEWARVLSTPEHPVKTHDGRQYPGCSQSRPPCIFKRGSHEL